MKTLQSYQFIELSQNELNTINGGSFVGELLTAASIMLVYVLELSAAIIDGDPGQAAEATEKAFKSLGSIQLLA